MFAEPSQSVTAFSPTTTQQERRLDVSVVIPVLNERESIAELAQRVDEVLTERGCEFEIVFVDDGSNDGTPEAIKALRDAFPSVKLLRFRRNFGKAAALSAGFEHSRGRFIVTLDGDLQDDPKEIPRFLDLLEEDEYDLVSGWKRRRKDPLSRRLLSKVYNWVTRQLARIDLHDFNCGFKAYRREVFDHVSVYGELHRYIPVLASRQGFRVGEIAVKHHARKHGRSKYGWDRLYKGPLDLITVLFITRYTRRPLHLFGVLGLLLAGSGFVICAYLALTWFGGASLSNRPLLLLGVLMILLGIQVLTTGLIGEMLTFKSFRSSDSYAVKESVGFKADSTESDSCESSS
ncbi:MAG: glycosyltransferase family 2 protein [Acidobacteriota bacterium]